jgi:hypothetical protein
VFFLFVLVAGCIVNKEDSSTPLKTVQNMESVDIETKGRRDIVIDNYSSAQKKNIIDLILGE